MERTGTTPSEWFLGTTVAVLAGGIALPWFFGRLWPLELFTHFYPQFGAAFFLLGFTLILAGRRGPALVALAPAVLIFLWLAPHVRGRFFPHPISSSNADKADLTLALFNTGSRIDALREWMLDFSGSDPDLVFVLEVRPSYREYLDSLGERYPHRSVRVRSDNFGLAVLSKRPLRSARFFFPGGSPVPWWAGALRYRGRRLSCWLVHTTPPISGRYFRVRNRQLAWIARSMRRREAPDVVLGDLNVSPGSPYFQDLRGRRPWKHYVGGNPLYFTWGGALPLAWTAIDHVFYRSDRAVPIFLKRGSFHGSDHRPIHVGLRFLPR